MPASSAKAEDIAEEIRTLEEAIAERSRVLQDKRKECEDEQLDLEEAKRAATEAEQRLANAQEDFRLADQTRSGLLPQYERCQQNQDQHKKAEAFKEEIKKNDEAMRAADSRIRELEARLQKVSTEYKAEREKRCLLADRVITMLDELRIAVEEKVTLTLPIDESTQTPHGSVSFRAICETAREREVAIAQCARHAAEIAAIVRMKQQRVQEMRVEADRDVAALKAVKDEQIKRMVLKFDEERQSIQQDIDTVETANEDLRRQLRNTRHTHSDPSTGSTMSGYTSRRESARPASAAAAKRTKELEAERERLHADVHAASSERKRLVSAMRSMNAMIQTKEAEHQKSMQALESQIHRDKNTVVQLERENQRLEAACDALVSSIEASRRTAAIAAGPEHAAEGS